MRPSQANIPLKYVVTMAWRIHKNYSDHDATVMCGDEDEDEDGPGTGLPIRPWFKRPGGSESQLKLFSLASEAAWKDLAGGQVKRRQDAEKMLNDVKAEAVTDEVLAAAPSRRRRRTQLASEPLPLPAPAAATAPIEDAVEEGGVS